MHTGMNIHREECEHMKALIYKFMYPQIRMLKMPESMNVYRNQYNNAYIGHLQTGACRSIPKELQMPTPRKVIMKWEMTDIGINVREETDLL